MKLKLFSLVLTIFLFGCSSSPYITHSFDSSNKSSKSVSIIPMDVSSYSVCNPTIPSDCSSSQDNFHMATAEVFTESGIFNNVLLGNGDTDLKIYLRLDSDDETLSFTGFLKLLVSACTAFLVPIPYEYTFNMRYNVYQGEENVGTFVYSRNSTEFVSHFGNLGLDLQKHAAKSIATEFIKDAQDKGIL